MEPTIRKGEQNPEIDERTQEASPEFPEEGIEPALMGELNAVDGNQFEPFEPAPALPENDDQHPKENLPQFLEDTTSIEGEDQATDDRQAESIDETAVPQTAQEAELKVDYVTQSGGETVSTDQDNQLVGASQPITAEQSELLSSFQEDPPSEAIETPSSINSELDNPVPQDQPQQFTADFLPIPSFEEVSQETNPRKIALVLSGGGARGAFQVGAEKYAREVKGYQWDIIAGVSVGAMNGAMLAMHRYARLMELWDTVSDQKVYTGGFHLISLIKILLGAKSFYGNEPLKQMMEREFDAGRILDDLHVGAVSLINGEYVQFTKESLELSKAILASASIPVVWPPVDVSVDYPAMVDGGVRNITPIGDVLEQEPDEIVIINCGNQNPPLQPNAAASVLSIGLRALDIMQNEIFINDMKQFLRINSLVKEAEQQGTILHHPSTGKPYKYYPYQVIEPDLELGEVLDFSQKSVQASLKAGVRRAREVLGRP